MDELGKRDTDARNTTLSMNMLLIHEKKIIAPQAGKGRRGGKRHNWKDHNVYTVGKKHEGVKRRH
jgi:hypothetical protein